MSEAQIRAADAIIQGGRMTPLELYSIIKHLKSEDEEGSREVSRMADYLHEDGLIKVIKGDFSKLYQLTTKGDQFKSSGRSYADYLGEKKQKAERDDLIKDMQAQDLITKLNTINPNQLDFWRSQKARNKQATVIALVAAAFSLAALLKTYGYLP